MASRVQLSVRFSLESRADAENAIVLNPEVRDLIHLLRRVDDAAVGNAKNAHDAPSKVRWLPRRGRRAGGPWLAGGET